MLNTMLKPRLIGLCCLYIMLQEAIGEVIYVTRSDSGDTISTNLPCSEFKAVAQQSFASCKCPERYPIFHVNDEGAYGCFTSNELGCSTSQPMNNASIRRILKNRRGQKSCNYLYMYVWNGSWGRGNNVKTTLKRILQYIKNYAFPGALVKMLWYCNTKDASEDASDCVLMKVSGGRIKYEIPYTSTSISSTTTGAISTPNTKASKLKNQTVPAVIGVVAALLLVALLLAGYVYYKRCYRKKKKKDSPFTSRKLSKNSYEDIPAGSPDVTSPKTYEATSSQEGNYTGLNLNHIQDQPYAKIEPQSSYADTNIYADAAPVYMETEPAIYMETEPDIYTGPKSEAVYMETEPELYEPTQQEDKGTNEYSELSKENIAMQPYATLNSMR